MKMSKKKYVGILAILLVILLVLVGVVYSRTDLLKSPSTLFYKYIAQNMEIYPKIEYNQILENVKNLNEKDYVATGSMNIKVNGNEDKVQVIKQIENLKLDYKTVKAKKDNETELNIMFSDKNIAKINTKSEDNNKFGIKIDGIYDKYIGIENNNLKDLAEKLGVKSSELPEKIKNVDLYDLLYISNEDINAVKGTYNDLLKEVINKEKYVASKNVETVVNKKSIKANAYSLKLNEKELLEIKRQFLEKIRTDELLLNLIESKAKKINENTTNEKIKKEIDKLINESNMDLKDAKETNYTEIVVYESRGQTVKTEVKNFKKEKEKEKLEINLDREGTKLIADIIGIENNKKISESIINKDESFTENMKNFKYEVNVDEEGAKAKLNIEYTKSDDNINLNITSGTDEIDISFIINEKIEYTSDEKIEKMNDENSVILNNKSKEEITTLMQEVMQNAQKYLVEKAKAFGMSESIFEGFGMKSQDGVEESNDARIYMDLMEQYQNGEITEFELNQRLNALGL